MSWCCWRRPKAPGRGPGDFGLNIGSEAGGQANGELDKQADDVGASNNFAGISVSKEALEGCGSSQLSSATAAASSSEDAVLQAKLRVDFADLTFNEMIGKGSFKTVYRGRWNNTAVAIVCMRKGGMVTEARVLQRLSNHPNLVQFYRWSTDKKGNEYMVLELVRLGSLDKLLLSYGNAVRTRSKLVMCEQICAAMCELVDENVLHRDLAARNILVQSMEPVHIKVTDFGLATRGAIQGSGAANGHEDNSAHDPAAAALSVPVRWSAPEVLLRAEWSEKSDVWSYGVTLWEVFSDGAEPFARKSDKEVVAAVLSGELLPRPVKCPREVYRLMLQCWAQEPKDRPTFASISQLFKKWRETYQAQLQQGGIADDSSAMLLPMSTDLPRLEGSVRFTSGRYSSSSHRAGDSCSGGGAGPNPRASAELMLAKLRQGVLKETAVQQRVASTEMSEEWSGAQQASGCTQSSRLRSISGQHLAASEPAGATEKGHDSEDHLQREPASDPSMAGGHGGRAASLASRPSTRLKSGEVHASGSQAGEQQQKGSSSKVAEDDPLSSSASVHSGATDILATPTSGVEPPAEPGMPSFTTRMMDNMVRSLGGDSIHMSFDVEQSIEPIMSYSTLNTSTAMHQTIVAQANPQQMSTGGWAMSPGQGPPPTATSPASNSAAASLVVQQAQQPALGTTSISSSQLPTARGPVPGTTGSPHASPVVHVAGQVVATGPRMQSRMVPGGRGGPSAGSRLQGRLLKAAARKVSASGQPGMSGSHAKAGFPLSEDNSGASSTAAAGALHPAVAMSAPVSTADEFHDSSLLQVEPILTSGGENPSSSCLDGDHATSEERCSCSMSQAQAPESCHPGHKGPGTAASPQTSQSANVSTDAAANTGRSNASTAGPATTVPPWAKQESWAQNLSQPGQAANGTKLPMQSAAVQAPPAKAVGGYMLIRDVQAAFSVSQWQPNS